MGIGASKSKESKRGATTKLGKGVVIPEDTEPYPGFQVQYHVIDVQVCVYNVTTFKYTSITPSPSIKRSLTTVPEIISWPLYYVHLPDINSFVCQTCIKRSTCIKHVS